MIYFFSHLFYPIPLIETGFNLAPSLLSSSELRTGKYGICELETSSQWGICELETSSQWGICELKTSSQWGICELETSFQFYVNSQDLQLPRHSHLHNSAQESMVFVNSKHLLNGGFRYLNLKTDEIFRFSSNKKTKNFGYKLYTQFC